MLKSLLDDAFEFEIVVVSRLINQALQLEMGESLLIEIYFVLISPRFVPSG